MVETEPGIDAEMDVFVTTPRSAGGTGLIARVMNADDALLIAAAPDLLAALDAMAHYFSQYEKDDSAKHVFKAARAAIAKATGERR